MYWTSISRGGMVLVTLVSLTLGQATAVGGPAGGTANRAVVDDDVGRNPSSDGGGAYTRGVLIDNLPGSYRNGGALDTRVDARFMTWDLSQLTQVCAKDPPCLPFGPVLVALKDTGDRSHDAVMRMVPYVQGAWIDGRLDVNETIRLRDLVIGQPVEFYLLTEVFDNQTGAFEFIVGTHNGFLNFVAHVTRVTRSSWVFVGSGTLRVQHKDEVGDIQNISFQITISQ